LFQVILAAVAIIAGAIASVAGFGIGSLLTPLIAIKTGTGIAVAGVSIAHFFGTALRFFLLRKFVNKKLLVSFGLTSAAGGLTGALLHNIVHNTVLTVAFSSLLILTGILGLTGLSERLRFTGVFAWIAGGLSGFFGGLVGNQGSIRSAALLGFEVDKESFVATATGIALMVDLARMPVYLAVQGSQIASIWQYILIASVGIIIGTLAGKKVLEKLPQSIFKKTVSVIILCIGIIVIVT
jgi:uncharacterized protein